LDRECIINSVKKTNRIVTVEEGWPQHGIGSEIAACLMESDGFDHLDAPLQRVTSAEVPTPYSISLETAAIPQISDVVKVCLGACYRNKK